jgi:hypothetical protein
MDLSPLWNAIGVGIAGIVTTGLTTIATMLVSKWQKSDRDRKVKKAIDDAVLATEQRGKSDDVHGSDKYQLCLLYAKALLVDAGVKVPDDLILEAKIHAKLADRNKLSFMRNN